MSDSRDELHAKLRRLRREPAGDVASPSSPPFERAAMPAWLAERLGRREATPVQGSPGTCRPAASLEGRQVGAPAALREVAGPRGSFAVRELRLPADYRHGAWSLSEVSSAEPADLAMLAKDEGLLTLRTTNAVYLDIETTGLSGGAGTTSFLVGLGWFEPELGEQHDAAPRESGASTFVLWQGFLRGPEEESAMLEEVAQRVRSSSGVVSFFGKSFDRHRLEDKMRVHGVDPPFDGTPHLDLYHPLRRLYREALENAKLQTMEHALCEVTRADDLPGSFAPAAWFDFLAGRAHQLEAVFRHNADDVLSLVVLAAHLARTLHESRVDGESLRGCPRSRARGVVRVLDAQRRREEALPWLERATAPPIDDALAPEQTRKGLQNEAAFERIVARVRRAAARAKR